ncbi:hypothetical protein, partial [Enterococcus faecium]|uniref:hypothetical protein n=1 Tax=Enterococcus faecium TaxID=1352 RepID=UPI003CC56591
MFQHNNDPKHCSIMVRTFLAKESYTVLYWPSNSPDMNIIKNLWGYLDDAVCSCLSPPLNLQQLWEILQEEWYKIPMD